MVMVYGAESASVKKTPVCLTCQNALHLWSMFRLDRLANCAAQSFLHAYWQAAVLVLSMGALRTSSLHQF